MSKSPVPAPVTGKRAERYAAENHLRQDLLGDGYAGFALEVGEPPDHADFDHFQQAVMSRGGLDLSRLDAGIVELTGSDGHRLRLEYRRENDLLRVVRDGQVRAWERERDVYAAASAGPAPIREGWLSGRLVVEAGGWHFESRVNEAGEATFNEQRVEP